MVKAAVKKIVMVACGIQRRVRVMRLVSALDSRATSGRRTAVPDPVEMRATTADRDRLRAEWGMDQGRYWYLIIGLITTRKNVDIILDGLVRYAQRPSGIVIAGEVDAQVAQQISARVTLLADGDVSMRTVDRLLSDWEFDAAISAADCVVTAHSNDSPSGVLVKAALAGTRIVAAGAPSLREDCTRLADSAHWVPLRLDAIGAALARSAELPRPRGEATSSGRQFASAMLWSAFDTTGRSRVTR